jgi:hypothetical protein
MKAQEAVIGKGFGKFTFDLFIALYGVPSDLTGRCVISPNGVTDAIAMPF